MGMDGGNIEMLRSPRLWVIIPMCVGADLRVCPCEMMSALFAVDICPCATMVALFATMFALQRNAAYCACRGENMANDVANGANDVAKQGRHAGLPLRKPPKRPKFAENTRNLLTKPKKFTIFVSLMSKTRYILKDPVGQAGYV